MFGACIMNNLEMKILEHRYPSSPTFVCVKINGKPLKGFVVSPKKKKGLVEILSEMHYAPYEGIAFAFNRMEMLLNWKQSFVGISNNLFLFSNFCDRMAPTPLMDQSTSKINGCAKFGLVKTRNATKHLLKVTNAPW
jgi:hypothetical protein